MPAISPPSIVANLQYERKSVEHGSYEKLAIAATVILSILTVAAFAYLFVWYLRRRRTRRHRQHNQENYMFCQSTVSLAEDTGKALDEFLMTDIQPQRTSIARGPRRSPSITMVFEDAYKDSPPQPYMTSYDSSVSTLHINALTPISSEESGHGPSSSQVAEASAEKRSSASTPRASFSFAAPSARSSQMWTTTSADTDTDTSSLLHQLSVRSRHSQAMSQSPTSPPSLRSSRTPTRRSIDTRELGRPYSVVPFQTGSRMLSEMEASRRTSSRPPVPSSFRYSSPA
jgi:hypothetical protein